MDKNKYIEDIEYLLKNLPLLHKNLSALIPKEKFLSIGDSIIQRVQDKNFKSEYFNLLLLSLLSPIKDPHTSTYTNGGRAPIYFEWIFGGYYPFIIPENYGDYLGKKLIKINGFDIDRFCEECVQYIVFDNEEHKKTELARSLNNVDIIRYISNNHNDEIEYTFEDNRSIFLAQEDPNTPTKQTSVYRIDGNKYLNMKYNYFVEKKDNSLYFKYTRCREDNEYKMRDLKKDIKSILKAKPQKIIIDLRNNAGGDSSLLSPIINVIKTYQRVNKPDIYCLINRRVFSSGVLNTYDIKHKFNATLVGQPTGQGVNHYGEIKKLVLPNSKIEIQYSSKYFKLIEDDSHNILPDVLIEPNIDDIMSGKDSILDYCLNN